MQYVPCIIFSVSKSNLTDLENNRRSRIAENDLHRMNVSYTKVLGMYQGSSEWSYLVTDMTAVSLVIGMAKEYDQDSILLRDNENNCTLKYFDGRPMESIGKLERVDVLEAFNGTAYTYNPITKQYFMCK
jgi:hypothetical protein